MGMRIRIIDSKDKEGDVWIGKEEKKRYFVIFCNPRMGITKITKIKKIRISIFYFLLWLIFAGPKREMKFFYSYSSRNRIKSCSEERRWGAEGVGRRKKKTTFRKK